MKTKPKSSIGKYNIAAMIALMIALVAIGQYFGRDSISPATQSTPVETPDI